MSEWIIRRVPSEEDFEKSRLTMPTASSQNSLLPPLQYTPLRRRQQTAPKMHSPQMRHLLADFRNRTATRSVHPPLGLMALDEEAAQVQPFSSSWLAKEEMDVVKAERVAAAHAARQAELMAAQEALAEIEKAEREAAAALAEEEAREARVREEAERAAAAQAAEEARVASKLKAQQDVAKGAVQAALSKAVDVVVEAVERTRQRALDEAAAAARALEERRKRQVHTGMQTDKKPPKPPGEKGEASSDAPEDGSQLAAALSLRRASASMVSVRDHRSIQCPPLPLHGMPSAH
jgi:hypothetical protein